MSGEDLDQVMVTVEHSGDDDKPVRMQFESVERADRNFVWTFGRQKAAEVAAGIRAGDLEFLGDLKDDIADRIERLIA